tara:strand:+ start:7637 stop:8137 length:501 start_codon:yes stop_codon:yes gene_type:complete
VKLNEKKLEPSIDMMINEFGELSNEIDRVKSVLNKLSSKYKVIENQLRPLLEQLHSNDIKSMKTDKYLVTLKRVGYERVNYKYKQSFEESLKKVNEQTKRVLKEILQQTETVTNVVSSIGVQSISENILKKVFSKLLRGYRKYVKPLFRLNKELDNLNGLLRKMVG